MRNEGLPWWWVVETLSSDAGGVGLNPGRGPTIPYACLVGKKPKHKTEAIYNKFYKDFQSGPHTQKFLKKMNKVWAEVLELIHWVLELILCSIWSSEWDELSRIPSGNSFSPLLPSRTPCQLVLSSPLLRGTSGRYHTLLVPLRHSKHRFISGNKLFYPLKSKLLPCSSTLLNSELFLTTPELK